MADTDIVQTIAEARVDARSLSEFVFKPASFVVTRRLAPPINTLEYYLNLFNKTATDGAAMMNQIIINSGFVTIDSFELGATITQRNEALRHTVDGKLYRWAGDLPKVVPASSTPTSSGGMGDNAWLEVSDVALRQDLTNPDKGAAMVARSVIVVNSVSEMIELTAIKVGSTVQTKGYYTLGDGGGNTYEIVAGGTGTADGGSIISVGSGLFAKASFGDGVISVERFGAKKSADASASLQAATDYALSVGIDSVVVNGEYTAETPILHRGEINYIGSGSISGLGLYRREVKSVDDPTSPPQFLGDLIADKHLKNLALASKPIAVIVGSSTGTLQPQSVDRASTLYHLLSERLSEDTGRDVTMFNRAIGGTTLTTLDGVPTNAAWANVSGKPWLDYIEDLSPDVVFIVIGSNDSDNMSIDRLSSVVSKIKAWDKPCDIVFITQPAPSISAVGSYASFSTKEAQEGRDYSAGGLRSYANFYGIGLIDGNRMGGILVDGRDVLNSSSKRVLTGHKTNGLSYTADKECRDFTVRLKYTGGQSNIDPYFLVGGTYPPRISIGRGGNDSVHIIKTSTGYVDIRLFMTAAAADRRYSTIATEIPFPDDNFELEFGISGNVGYFEIISAEGNKKKIFNVIRMGGLFSPTIGFLGQDDSPWSEITYLNMGESLKYRPQLTATEMWGNPTNDADTKYPYGGNGINHMASAGNKAVWGTLLYGGIFRCDNTSGTYTPIPTILSLTAISDVIISECWWSKSGSVVTVNGAVTVDTLIAGTGVFTLTLPTSSKVPETLSLSGMLISHKARGVVWADSSNPTQAYFTVLFDDAGKNNHRFSISYLME